MVGLPACTGEENGAEPPTPDLVAFDARVDGRVCTLGRKNARTTEIGLVDAGVFGLYLCEQ